MSLMHRSSGCTSRRLYQERETTFSLRQPYHTLTMCLTWETSSAVCCQQTYLLVIRDSTETTYCIYAVLTSTGQPQKSKHLKTERHPDRLAIIILKFTMVFTDGLTSISTILEGPVHHGTQPLPKKYLAT